MSPDADPDAIVDQILALLSEDRYPSARRLAAEAVARHPGHARVRNAWAIFDPHGKATVASEASERNRAEEFEWLRQPPESARGKWVALVGSDMVAAADTLVQLVESLRRQELSKTPLVHYIA